MTVRTAEQVYQLYETLWDVAPVNESDVDHAEVAAARSLTRQKGWLPPLTTELIRAESGPLAESVDSHDVDEVAVDRALKSDGVQFLGLAAQEQAEVVRRLTTAGASIVEIAARVGVSERTVSRRRSTFA